MTHTRPTNSAADLAGRPEGLRRVTTRLARQGRRFAPQWLNTPARSCAAAAALLGLQAGQITKSAVFKRQADGLAVRPVDAGDQPVDKANVAARVHAIGRADAAFVKQQTGVSIAGVVPVGHQPVANSQPPLVPIDPTRLRCDAGRAAARHRNGVFCRPPAQAVALTGAPVVDLMADLAVAEAAA